jgi:hypothetical protein
MMKFPEDNLDKWPEGEILDDTDARMLGLGIMLILVGLLYLFEILPG